MSLGRVVLTWVAGTHEFNVCKLGERLELEAKCEAGTQEILRRLIDGQGRFADVRETIRIGLIGGGMTSVQAEQLVRRHVDEAPRAENLPLAKAILMAEIMGIPEGDEVGKSEADRAATTETASTETAGSSDPQSSASAPRSVTLPLRPTDAPSGSYAPPWMDTSPPTEPTKTPPPS